MQKHIKLIVNVLYVLTLLVIYCISNLQTFCIMYALVTTLFTIARSFYSEVKIIDNVLDCIIFQLPIALILLLREDKIIETRIRLIVFSIIIVNVIIIFILQLYRKKPEIMQN